MSAVNKQFELLEFASGFVDGPRQSDCTAGQMDGEAGWWTTNRNIGLPPLARVMGVGRQQQQEPSSLHNSKHTLYCDSTAGQINREAGWLITSGKIGLPPLSRVKGVGRQQQHGSQTKNNDLKKIPVLLMIFFCVWSNYYSNNYINSSRGLLMAKLYEK